MYYKMAITNSNAFMYLFKLHISFTRNCRAIVNMLVSKLLHSTKACLCPTNIYSIVSFLHYNAMINCNFLYPTLLKSENLTLFYLSICLSLIRLGKFSLKNSECLKMCHFHFVVKIIKKFFIMVYKGFLYF